jgi:hypothetical protein
MVAVRVPLMGTVTSLRPAGRVVRVYDGIVDAKGLI